MLNKKGKEITLTTKTRDEVYTTSNHHLIEITANAQLLNLTTQPRKERRIPVRLLKQEKRRELYQKLLKEEWSKIEDTQFDDLCKQYIAYKTIITSAAKQACSTKEIPRSQRPRYLGELMAIQKTAHLRYKRKLQANDPTWEEDLKTRNEARNEYKRKLRVYLTKDKETNKLE